jgi:hypothetical protein
VSRRRGEKLEVRRKKKGRRGNPRAQPRMAEPHRGKGCQGGRSWRLEVRREEEEGGRQKLEIGNWRTESGGISHPQKARVRNDGGCRLARGDHS